MITFEEFKKLDIRAARVIEAERIEGSEQLLKPLIDLGEEKRQIISGIAKFYQPENLIGKEIIVLVNLEPKFFFGLESQGMLLAVDIEKGCVLLEPDKKVSPGSKVT